MPVPEPIPGHIPGPMPGPSPVPGHAPVQPTPFPGQARPQPVQGQPQQAPSPAPQAAPAQAAPATLYPNLDDPDVLLLHNILRDSGKNGYSDVHVHPGKPVHRVREGVLSQIPNGFVRQDQIYKWMRHATQTPMNGADPLERTGHVGAAVDAGTVRARAAFRMSMQGLTVTFRIIPEHVPDVNKIGVPPQIQRLYTRTSGLVILEGPTGSGKTTFNAAMIKKINDELDKHIYLVEDPIEFVHPEVGNTVITQRQIGIHASDYPSAIEDALRSKPNVIVVGELLNPATAKAALHAATTGHLVFTTAHAGSVTEAIDAFIGQFTADEQPQIRSRFSQSLLAIVVQNLIPDTDGRLTPVREVMINDKNFSELIRTSNMQMMRGQLDGTSGCHTLETDIVRLVEENKISPEVALEVAKEPQDVQNGLERLKGRKRR